MALAASGCMVTRFDAETNTVHWWGIGHFAAHASVPEDGLQALAVSGEVVGLDLQSGPDAGVTLGFGRRQRLWVTKADAAFRLYGPSGRLIELDAAGFREPHDDDAPPAENEASEATTEGTKDRTEEER